MATRHSEPAVMDATKPPETGYLVEEAPFEKIVQITETPWDQTEARNAEKRVKDLGVNLKPDPARGLEIGAIFDAMKVLGVAHVLIPSTHEKQKQHSSPGNDIQTVNDD